MNVKEKLMRRCFNTFTMSMKCVFYVWFVLKCGQMDHWCQIRDSWSSWRLSLRGGYGYTAFVL